MIGCPGPLERACGPAIVERGGAATVPTTAATNTVAATAASATGQVVLSSGFLGRERLTGLAPYPTGAWQPSRDHHIRPCAWCFAGSELLVHVKSLGSHRPLPLCPRRLRLAPWCYCCCHCCCCSPAVLGCLGSTRMLPWTPGLWKTRRARSNSCITTTPAKRVGTTAVGQKFSFEMQMSGGQGGPLCSWEMPGFPGEGGQCPQGTWSRLAGHIVWLLQEWSQSERLCGARWVLVACQPLGTRYLQTQQESSLARHRAPSFDGVADFIGVHSSWKFPAKFPKVCSYSWEEIRRQTEKLHGRQKEELPRETAHLTT